ncbi:MAG: hypothetical protein ACTSWA_10020, partial [Candidatus Thorarchaeota archaeon]
DHKISELSKELEDRQRTDTNPDDVDSLWAAAGRVIKESRVLADAQSSDMLSFQLTHEIETLDSDLTDAMARYDTYRETINQAIALKKQIDNEWHWMERNRTNLIARKEFLETSLERISTAHEDAESEGQVQTILTNALDEYNKIFGQIDRIVSSSDNDTEEILPNRDETIETIESLLVIIPKKREALGVITDPEEHEIERLRLVSALKQALESATSLKISKVIKAIEAELSLLDQTNS